MTPGPSSPGTRLRSVSPGSEFLDELEELGALAVRIGAEGLGGDAFHVCEAAALGSEGTTDDPFFERYP